MRGKKRDLQFVKDLAIVAFGPEVLASLNIFGTAKGGNRNRDFPVTERSEKPRLDIDTLEVIRGEFPSMLH